MAPILTVDRTRVKVGGMATDEGFPDTTDRRADPGPLPAPPVEHVNQLRDAMQLTDHERDQVIDYVSGYDPRCMLAALDHIGRRRQDLAAAAAVLEA
jgi:hypothetical protein